MKKSITVTNLTLDLWMQFVRPALIAADMLEEVPAKDDWHEYTAEVIDEEIANEIAHCMSRACFITHDNGKYTAFEEAVEMVNQLEVSAKYKPVIAEVLTVIKEAIAAEVETCETAAEVETLTRNDRIMECLENMDSYDLVYLHNQYCEATNCPDDYIYLMEEFDEIMSSEEPWEIARKCFYGHEFNPNHEWFYFNRYGNLESFDWIHDGTPIYREEIADYIDQNDNPLDNDEIAAILDGEEVE